MKEKSDGELIELVTKLKDDYQPAAVEAARKEIDERNLSTDQIETAESEIKERENTKLANAEQPLEAWQAILFVVFCWGIIPWAIAGTFKADGYHRKYKDAWKFMKIGLVTFVLIPLALIFIAVLSS
jgi:hypothetical protein